MTRTLLLFLSSILIVACQSRLRGPPTQTLRAVMESHDYAGLSGLTLDDRGRLWAVPERAHFLLRIESTEEVLRVAEAIPIDGYPEGRDLESVAFADGEFYVGTESLDSAREEDPIVVIVVGDTGRARVTRQFPFTYSSWNTTASRNNGVEGVCVAGNKLVASAEIVLDRPTRKAPVGVFDRETGVLEQVFEVPLTSETGTLSALDCNARGDVIDLRAVERHYGVARLIEAELNPRVAEVTTRVAADLSTRIDPLPNIEGIALDGESRVHIITDNQGRTVSGPTLLFSDVKGRGLFAADGD